MQKVLTHAYSEIVWASPGPTGRSSRIRHRNALTEKGLERRRIGTRQVCFHISISVIIHHQTLTGWKFYCEERKHQGILSFYPKRIIDKRITRIVSQNLQKAKQLIATTSKSRTAMSQTIVDNRMRYAKKSQEERKPAKFRQAACLKEDTCSSGTACANADLPGKATPHRLSENRTNLRKSAPGSDSGHRRMPM